MAGFSSFDPPKDQNDVDSFSWNWLPRLGTDTISTSAFTEPTGGITLDSDSKTTTTTTVVLSGGTAGQYNITNRITTANGHTLDKTLSVPVRTQ